MAFKVSNETKVGALAAVAITILVLGYNYLAGRDAIFSSGKTYFAKFENLNGLAKSNPIMYKGYKIGQVSEVTFVRDSGFFIVELDVQKNVKITDGSIASIMDADLFGSKAILMKVKLNNPEAKDGSYLAGATEASMLESLGTTVGPIAGNIDSMVQSINHLMSSKELASTIKNLESTSKNLIEVSDKLDQMLAENTQELNNIFKNVNSITTNLNNNSAVINRILANADSVTYNLSQLELQKTIAQANLALTNFNATLNKINNGEGTLSLLLKDPKLYNDIDEATKSLNKLIIDINKYPKRYFSIGSGKKAEKQRIKDIENKIYTP